ncbi:MAG: radical SAM/SPASM domain-containing protein [Desulfovibrio sp.]
MNAAQGKTRASRQEYETIRQREAQSKAYYERDDGVAAPPHTLCLSVNNNCFMSCKMCDIGTANASRMARLHENQFSDRYVQTRRYQELPFERIQDIVDEMAPFDPIIKTNFVEPLLYSRLRETAEYIKAKGLKYYTITNGWMLQKHAPWLAELADLVRVSLDGTAAVHDGIRGKKDSHARTIAGLKALVEAKRLAGRKRPIVGLCYTVSNFNYFNLLECMEGLEREGLLGEVYINFNHLLYTTQWEIDETRAASPLFVDLKRSSIDNIALLELRTDVLQGQIEALATRYPQSDYHHYFSPWLKNEDLEAFYDPATRMFPGTPCYLPWYAAQLDLEGNIGIYGHCILPNLGNAFDQGFMAAWNSERARQIRLELKQAGSFPACNKCIGTLYPLRGRE